MSPSRSKTSVWPSGDTSTDIQVPSLVSKASLRASVRGLLMSAATSGFFSFAASGAGSLASAGAASVRAESVRKPSSRLRIGSSIVSA